MKISKTFLSLYAICLPLMSFQCEEEVPDSCQDRLDFLNTTKAEILELLESSICNETFKCRSIAFGSKPCGGPWTYLVYSTSIDTTRLKKMVEVYNVNEQNYNIKCNQCSDCSIANPPTSIDCIDNKCVPVF